MDIEAARFGFCIGIERAYRGMDRRASQEAPFTVAHQNSKNAFDTLRRIETGDPELLRRYPSLSRVSVEHDLNALHDGDRLVLGFHGVTDQVKDELTGRGVDVLDDLICPFIAKLDRVVEQNVLAGFDIAMVGSPDNHHLRTAKKIASDHGRRCFAIVKPEDIDDLPYQDGRPVVLVGEVTGNTQIFHEVIKRIEEAGRRSRSRRRCAATSTRGRIKQRHWPRRRMWSFWSTMAEMVQTAFIRYARRSTRASIGSVRHRRSDRSGSRACTKLRLSAESGSRMDPSGCFPTRADDHGQRRARLRSPGTYSD